MEGTHPPAESWMTRPVPYFPFHSGKTGAFDVIRTGKSMVCSLVKFRANTYRCWGTAIDL
jgi:hypothetical protein